MIPIKQTILGSNGDCFRAAVASVLHLDIEHVPHFYDGCVKGEPVPPVELAYMRDWFADRGLYPIEFALSGNTMFDVMDGMSEANPGVHYLLSGCSVRGHDHTVVCKDYAMVHDPHPSCRGLVGPQSDGHFHVTIIAKLI